MALSTVQIARPWMSKASNPPTGGCVALGTVIAKETHMAVLGRVASATVKCSARGAFVELSGTLNPQPLLHRLESGRNASIRGS